MRLWANRPTSMSEWNELKNEIEVTLNDVKESLESYNPLNGDPMIDNCEGWVEALKYVLGRMNFYENKDEEE